jgi:hypothetical protein
MHVLMTQLRQLGPLPNGEAPWEIAMRSRVLAQVLAAAAVAAAISMLAQCGGRAINLTNQVELVVHVVTTVQ